MPRFRIAEVRNFEDDPTKSGRCQVRIYSYQNDTQHIKDEHLPWAAVLHPVTSAATAKVGIIPSGLLVGSRVLITYLDDDLSEQFPIILGSLGRGDLPTNKGIRSTSDEDSGGVINTPGPDNPGWTNS